jgi:hypothetical protein
MVCINVFHADTKGGGGASRLADAAIEAGEEKGDFKFFCPLETRLLKPGHYAWQFFLYHPRKPHPLFFLIIDCEIINLFSLKEGLDKDVARR